MAKWIKPTGSEIPEAAIRAGYEADGKPLFIARASMEGVLTPGKCGQHLSGAQIPYDCKDQTVDQYEVLVLPSNANGYFDWKHDANGNVPQGAFQTDNGIYVGRILHSGSLIPWKIATNPPHKCAYFGYGGKELNTKEYEVLCQIK